MAFWRVSPKDKKSINEHTLWQKDDQVIRIITGWRSGVFYLETDDENPPVLETYEGPYETGVELYDLDYGVDLDHTSDGWYTDIIWPDDMPDDERERLLTLWEEESYTGFEEEGWYVYDTEIWLLGELDVVKEPE